MDKLETGIKVVDAFGVFRFDLNEGQTCEFVYPHDGLPPDDLKTISMLSFPDSQSISQSGEVDCVYTFCYRVGSSSKTPMSTGSSSSPLSEESFVQCYVYFRQVEDATNARGYYQKSFVLISSSSRLFSNADDLIGLVRRVGNKFYMAEETGCSREVLIDTFHHVEASGLYRLRTSSSDIGTGLTPLSTRSLELSGSPLSPSHSAFALESIYLLIEGLWHLWEAVLVGLPIMVYCPGRADLCSRAVLALTSLISPVEYVGDIRPFLSIFDPDYSSFRSSGPRTCIVGVTSPMACQQLSESFSVIVSFHSPDDASVIDMNRFVEVAKSDRGGRMYISDSITSVCSGTKTRMSSLASRLSLLSLPSPSSGYRLVVPGDVESVCNKFVSSSDRINRGIITRHFSLLTRDLLMPFLEYIQTDSSSLNGDLFRETPCVSMFVPNKFLSSLSLGVGKHLSSISTEKLRALYAGFIRTSSFRNWLNANQRHAVAESIIAHAELISSRLTEDKILWMSVNEKERAVDRMRRLMDQLQDSAKAHSLSENLRTLVEFINA
jgi:hypothetical protein